MFTILGENVMNEWMNEWMWWNYKFCKVKKIRYKLVFDCIVNIEINQISLSIATAFADSGWVLVLVQTMQVTFVYNLVSTFCAVFKRGLLQAATGDLWISGSRPQRRRRRRPHRRRRKRRRRRPSWRCARKVAIRNSAQLCFFAAAHIECHTQFSCTQI